MQQAVFDVIGLSAEEARSQFGFLLDAFKYGPPPHGGIAFGWDRVTMLLAGAASIRDVIAFPKAASGLDPSPAPPPPSPPPSAATPASTPPQHPSLTWRSDLTGFHPPLPALAHMAPLPPQYLLSNKRRPTLLAASPGDPFHDRGQFPVLFAPKTAHDHETACRRAQAGREHG
jgi:hypothetical protein